MSLRSTEEISEAGMMAHQALIPMADWCSKCHGQGAVVSGHCTYEEHYFCCPACGGTGHRREQEANRREEDLLDATLALLEAKPPTQTA